MGPHQDHHGDKVMSGFGFVAKRVHVPVGPSGLRGVRVPVPDVAKRGFATSGLGTRSARSAAEPGVWFLDDLPAAIRDFARRAFVTRTASVTS
jgi:hypothetical protein